MRRRRIHSSLPYLITDALPGHIDGRAHDLGLSGSHGSVGNIGHAERRGDGCPGIHGKAAASRCDAAFWMTSNERVAMKRKRGEQEKCADKSSGGTHYVNISSDSDPILERVDDVVHCRRPQREAFKRLDKFPPTLSTRGGID